jgi:serine/threonine protein kinase
LEQGEFLGRGTFADVHEVRCKGLVIARKQIHCSRHLNIEDVKRELDILKKISHKHAVTLLGSYTKNKILGLLLYPVAVCDLGVFLEELDEYQKTDPPHLGEGLEKLVDRLGFPGNIRRARERLNRVYGWNDGLYVTDFGLSRDTADASSSVTNGIERGTYKYCAPEVARYEPRGRAADVYSLGCMFLEINTVQRRLSLTAFDDFRMENEDRSFQNNHQKLLEWMSKLRQISIDIPACGVFDMVDIIEKMVAPNPSNRPAIGAVCSSLYVLGDLVYFGRCCPTPRYQTLVNENAQLSLFYAHVYVN